MEILIGLTIGLLIAFLGVIWLYPRAIAAGIREGKGNINNTVNITIGDKKDNSAELQESLKSLLQILPMSEKKDEKKQIH